MFFNHCHRTGIYSIGEHLAHEEFCGKFVFEQGTRRGEKAFPDPLPTGEVGNADPKIKAVHDPLWGRFQWLPFTSPSGFKKEEKRTFRNRAKF